MPVDVVPGQIDIRYRSPHEIDERLLPRSGKHSLQSRGNSRRKNIIREDFHFGSIFAFDLYVRLLRLSDDRDYLRSVFVGLLPFDFRIRNSEMVLDSQRNFADERLLFLIRSAAIDT